MSSRGPDGPVWVCVPTYDEAENVVAFTEAVIGVMEREGIDGHVLIADDASPDGTGRLADGLAARIDRVHVLHRAAKQGIGPAYRDAFRHALSQGAELVVEMDCDFSHDPGQLPALVGAARDADLVIGSRYVPGGRVNDWSLLRRAISRFGCVYAKTILGADVEDLTSGFKCFRRRVLEDIPLERVSAAGYGFQIEMTYRALRLGHRVREVPITFSDRTAGTSKMSGRIVAEAALLVPRLRRRRL